MRFPEDHPCEALRGRTRPSPGKTMRALARRALYLQQQLATVDRAQHHGDRWGYILEELAAIMIAVESLTARRGTDARPG